MIAGTSFSPAMAFIAFAHEFLDLVAMGEHGAALGRLDQRTVRWTRKRLQAAIDANTNRAGLCSRQGMTQSACPCMEEVSPGVFVLSHRLPVAGKWAAAKAIFRFTQKAGTDYFHVELEAIEP